MGMGTDIQALYQAGDQLKLREFLSQESKFADTVEVVSIRDE